MDLDYFIIEPVQGQAQGTAAYLAEEYKSLDFQDESGRPLHIRPFLKQHFLEKLRRPASSPTTDRNISSLGNLDGILDDLKSSNCFKNAVVKFSPKKDRFGKHRDLVVRLKKKSAYYFSVQQSFNAEGNIVVAYSGGLRNLSGMLDVLSFNLEKSLQKDKLATGNVTWSLPFWYGNTALDFTYFRGSSALDSRIVEQKESFSVRLNLPVKETTVRYSLEDRQNLFDPDDVCREVLLHEALPSLVHKFEYKFNLFRTARQKADLRLTQIVGESRATAFEADHSFRFPLQQLFGGDVPKKYRDIDFENQLNVRAIGFERGRLRINDCAHFSQVRGFSKIGERHPAYNASRHPRHQTRGFLHQGDHLGSRLGLRNTSKLLFNSFPFLQEAQSLKTFFHFTALLASPAFFPVDLARHSSLSAGAGVDLAYGPAHIEFLYNFWHRQAPHDLKNNFQVKFSMGD